MFYRIVKSEQSQSGVAVLIIHESALILSE